MDTNKIFIFATVINSVAILFIAGYLIKKDSRETDKQQISIVQSDGKPVESPLNPEEDISAPPPPDIELILEMDDNGFINKALQLQNKQKLTLTIMNKGDKNHSFNVEDFDIHSGPITPKETKTIKLDPQEAESATIEFYSSDEGDLKDNFKGVIMISNN